MSVFPELVVAVTVITQMESNRILAVWNPRWSAFTLPMTKQMRWQDPNAPAGDRVEAINRTAVRAAAEVLGKTLEPTVLRRLMPEERQYGQSDSDGTWKLYRLNIYGLSLVEDIGLPVRVAAEWLTPEQFAAREPVSNTARYVLAELNAHGMLPPWADQQA